MKRIGSAALVGLLPLLGLVPAIGLAQVYQPTQAPPPTQALAPSWQPAPRPALATMLRWAIPAVAWLAVAVVAVGVIGVHWHYFTDTIGGAALGTGTVCGLALALDVSLPRRTGWPGRAPVAR